jgi:hypothetical protein
MGGAIEVLVDARGADLDEVSTLGSEGMGATHH